MIVLYRIASAMRRIIGVRIDKVEIRCLSKQGIKSSINVKREDLIQRSFCGDIACGIRI